MAGQAQEPLTFEDVTVFLSRAEWDVLLAGQRELYRDVVLDTYELLTSLGYPGPKPDILHRLERGEEPWICPSPGHARSCLEEPSSGWWPGAGGCQGPEEEPEPSCPAGWSTSWRLQVRRLLKKFSCHEGRSEFPSEADSGVESQAQPWLVKVEVEEEPELMENPTPSETFPLHSVMEQQNISWEQLWADPREWNPGNAQNHGHAWGEATLLLRNWELQGEELRAVVAREHSYCLQSELGTPCAPRPWSPWEHDYCQRRQPDKSCWPRRNDATRCQLALQRSQSRSRRMVRKAREILHRSQLCRRLGDPGRGGSGCHAEVLGTNPGVSPPSDVAVPSELRSAKGVTSDTQRAPEGILGIGASPPAPIPAAGVRKGVKPLEDPGANGELVGGGVESCKSQRMSVQDVARNALKAVGCMLDSICQRFEFQGFSQGKSIWPIIIQIDNLEEIRKS